MIAVSAQPSPNEIEYFYDLRVPAGLIAVYSILLPFGFPPPVPARRRIQRSDHAGAWFSPANLSPLPSLIHAPIDFQTLSGAINAADRQIPDAISLHYRRMYGPGVLLLNACAAVIFMLPLLAFLSHVHATAVLPRFQALASSAPLTNAATVALLLVSALPLLLIIIRFHFRLIESRFADSICVRELLYLLLDLHRDDALLNPDRRRLILYRIDYISRTALLIASRYAGNSHNSQAWTKQHFRRISLHLQERARWVAAPTDDSLTALRRDFYALLCLFATGRYGNFDWQDSDLDDEALRMSPKQSRIEQLARVCGISLPLVAMGLYLSPVGTQLLGPKLPVDGSIVAYAFMAWLLLAIDRAFRLGIVQSLIDLAQGLRGLEK